MGEWAGTHAETPLSRSKQRAWLCISSLTVDAGASCLILAPPGAVPR